MEEQEGPRLIKQLGLETKLLKLQTKMKAEITLEAISKLRTKEQTHHLRIKV